MLWRDRVIMSPLQLTESRPDGTLHSPSKQYELVDPEPIGSTSLDSTDEGF